MNLCTNFRLSLPANRIQPLMSSPSGRQKGLFFSPPPKSNRDSNVPRGRPFAKGNKLAPGGPRPNSGRPPDWFRQQCQKAIEEARGVEFARDVLAGKDFPQLATGEGEVIPLPPPLKERLKALEWLTNRGYGMPNQPLEVTDVNERPSTEELLVTFERLKRLAEGIGLEKSQ